MRNKKELVSHRWNSNLSSGCIPKLNELSRIKKKKRSFINNRNVSHKIGWSINKITVVRPNSESSLRAVTASSPVWNTEGNLEILFRIRELFEIQVTTLISPPALFHLTSRQFWKVWTTKGHPIDLILGTPSWASASQFAIPISAFLLRGKLPSLWSLDQSHQF